MPFILVRNDITKMQVDVIVNPANRRLQQGSGTSRAIFLAAGEKELTEACREIGYCPRGSAVLTEAFHLNARYIIHAAGPRWKGGFWGEQRLLYKTYMESLKLAKEKQCESIAFPLLSSGNYGFPKEKAMETALRAIRDFLENNEMMIYLVLYDRASLSVSKKLIGAVEEYIDDHYTEEKDESLEFDRRLESRMENDGEPFGNRSEFDGYPGQNKNAGWGDFSNRSDSLETGTSSGYENRNWENPIPSVRSRRGGKREPKVPDRGYTANRPIQPIQVSGRSLDSLLKHLDETFSQMLLRLIDERGLKDSYVYKKANVDRRHFSKIRNDDFYAPNKKTVIAFVIALELTLDEAVDLMAKAGFAFSQSSRFDIIICYFLEHREYDIFKINEVLFHYGEPVLGE